MKCFYFVELCLGDISVYRKNSLRHCSIFTSAMSIILYITGIVVI